MPFSSNISVVLIVFMGMASGGMFALMLMAGRKQQVAFAIMLILSVFLALAGFVSGAGLLQNTPTGLVSAILLLVLAFVLGYTLTTFSVLSPRKRVEPVSAPPTRGRDTAVICLAPGEPAEYETRSAAAHLEIAEEAEGVSPTLLRPFQMRRQRAKYASVGRSPYRDYHIDLSNKVQARLEGSYHVYPAFYSDHPSFGEAARQAVEDGARQIVVAHVRVTDPPDTVKSDDFLEGLDPGGLGLKLTHLDPLWESDLLPQIYVRRVLEAVSQVDIEGEAVGLLLLGYGYATASEASAARHEQEHCLQRKMRRALLKLGFDESRIATGWLRETPTPAEALLALGRAGCKSVYWMPFSFPADGITTLYDIPAIINPVASTSGIRLVPLGAWNADELTAEEIAGSVRAASRVVVGRSL
jgi:protoheme ferro-lyase